MKVHTRIASIAFCLCFGVVAGCGNGETVAGPTEGQTDAVGQSDAGAVDAAQASDAGPTADTAVPTKDVAQPDAGAADAGQPGQDTATSGEDVGPGGCKSNDDCKDVLGAGACAYGLCNSGTGKCAVALRENGTSCDDGSACTDKDACAFGQCKGVEKTCDDKDPCTQDVCDPKTGQCGKTDVDLCQCEADSDCAGEEDGNLCNGTLKCDKAAKPHKCVVDPKTVVVCSKDGDSDCLEAKCVEKTGQCVPQPAADGKACEDSSVCTDKDTCKAGLCFGGQPVDCDDKNPCTADSCDPKAGCQHAPNKAACDDGDACTKADACVDGKCAGTGGTLDCDDDNPCTDDSCDPTKGCVNLPNKASCTDGNDCTDKDSCLGGKCVSGLSTCGCQEDADCAKFENGNLCDGVLQCDKVAFPYVCKVKPTSVVQCDESKNTDCLKNACDPKTGVCGLLPAAKGTDCSDGSKCTLADACDQGLCVGATAQSCDDGNPCTKDACDKVAGCQNTAADTGCDDNNACTVNDKCTDSKCVAGDTKNCNDGNPCTKDACDPGKGCVYSPLAGNCNDGDACTSSDQCTDGKCVGAKTTDCDDKDACTNDTCDDVQGCVHTANTAACEDGNACTEGDKCAAGKCVSGAKIDCDDKNVCTTDSCDPSKPGAACQHTPNAAACDDGTKCTSVDLCKEGKCVPGAPLDCQDGQTCTADSCDKDKGCVNLPITVTCTDGDPCSAADHCEAGKCVSSEKTNCDDGNACTLDLCDTKGCVSAATTAPCSDGDVCTANDACKAGKCVAGAAVPFCCKADSECNDGVACTIDKCASNVCTHNSDGGEVLLEESFEAPLKGWTITSNGKNNVTWQLVTDKAAIGKGSLYMGNPKAGNYDGDDFVASVTLPKLKVPMGSTRVSFNAWVDVEDNDDEFDVLYVLVNGTIYDELFASTKGWKSVEFDLSAAQGQEVEISLEFESGDELNNLGAGIWIDNLRIEQPKCGGGACTTHADCTDLNDCTGDLCVGGKCEHAPMPSHTVFHEDFDDVPLPGSGAAQGWTFSSTSQSTLWSISEKRARSGKQSLYLGDPKTGTYGQVKAQAKMPNMRIPTQSTTTLVLHAWMDVKDGGCDKDRIRVYAGAQNDLVATSCASTGGKWVMVTADLTPYASFYITPIIEFDTVDADNNGGEGVYVDDVSVVHEWACIGIDADFEPNYAFNFIVTSSSPTVRWHVSGHDKYEGIRSLQAADPAAHSYDGPAVTTDAVTGLPVCAGGTLQFRLLTKVADQGCDADVFSLNLGNLELFKQCGDTKGWELVSLNLDKYKGLSIPLDFRFVSNASNNKAAGAYIDALTLECP